MKKITFFVWAPYHRRSELLAQHLGAAIHYVHRGRSRNFVQAPGRYLLQAWETWRILAQERPEVIFIQNPPIFAVLVGALYARIHGARYVIDSHTGAFLGLKWGWSVGLHRLLSHGALLTIVHNRSQEEVVNRWGCRYCVLADPIGEYPVAGRCSFDGQFNALVVSSFSPDEPLPVVFAAAAELPEVTFYVTGDYSCGAPALLKRKPNNCRLTGYVPYQQYVSLLQGADVVIDLVSNRHTLLCGAFEAVSAGTPLIVSDWPVLRDCFSSGTIHIPNTVAGVCDGVRRSQREQAQLRRGMVLLREKLQAEWARKFAALQDLVDAA